MGPDFLLKEKRFQIVISETEIAMKNYWFKNWKDNELIFSIDLFKKGSGNILEAKSNFNI